MEKVRGCLICGSTSHTQIITVENAPKFHVIEYGKEINARLFGKISLVECTDCGHLFNNKFSTSAGHENDIFLTNTPISESMVARHKKTVDFLTLKRNPILTVLDVGAGSGALAASFAEVGHKVTVVEPSSAIDFASLGSYGISVVHDSWPSKNVMDQKFDLILCVQVLEHVDSPVDFLASIASSLQVDGQIYLEFPSGDWVVKHASLADIHFPHVSYFLSSSIELILQKVSLFQVIQRHLIGGRDVGIVLDASLTETKKFSFSSQAETFKSNLLKNLAVAELRIKSSINSRDFAIYGANAGSQSLFGFFPNLKPKYVFDDTPAYQGSSAFSVLNRFEITEPTQETLDSVELVIIAAYIHDKAIAERIRDLGFTGEILSLRPASDMTGTIESLFAT